ncbi:MAG: patatin family protein [Candidatus Binatia bacterium]
MNLAHNLARKGHPVIEAIKRRLGRLKSRPWSKDTNEKIGLVIEGGGMRGIISAGVVVGLERLGLNQAFDEVYAESAGALNACYFLAGHASFGARIYFEDICNMKFINPIRLTRIVDVDFAVDHVVVNVKPLKVNCVLSSESDFYVSLTDAVDGSRMVVNVRKTSTTRLLRILKATAALPILYNRAIEIEGRSFVDGGIADPIPIKSAIMNGCTHILVIVTRPPEFRARKARWLEERILRALLLGWDERLKQAFLTRHKRYNEARDIASGMIPAEREVNIAVIYPGPIGRKLSRLTKNPELSRQAMEESADLTIEFFR